jgi:Xaa-Pro aminopeptidase
MTTYLERRRERVAAAWDLTDPLVLVGAGQPIPLPGGADQTYPFLSHSDYFYLADRECVDGVVAYDPHQGWTDFVPDVTEDERVWEGRTDAEGTPLSGFSAWLAARRGRKIAMLGVPLPDVQADPALTAEMSERLLQARRPKDEEELDRLRRAAAATAAGFAAIQRLLQPGVTERKISIELETEFFRAGGERVAFGTIVGVGANSGVLHFTPGARAARDGDNVLIDAGAEIGRYVGDVTRTYRVGTKDGFFRDLYQVVLGAQERGIERCRPGVEWRDVHLAVARDMTVGLVALGILRGSPDSLVEQDAHALFFPHGLGHLVGLGVRDASGYLPGRKRSERFGLSFLRCDFPLEPGFVTTVEPGLYFVPALLQDPARRARYRDAVNWTKVDTLLGFGGIRIEDDVLVTAGGPEVLTAAVPKAL